MSRHGHNAGSDMRIVLKLEFQAHYVRSHSSDLRCLQYARCIISSSAHAPLLMLVSFSFSRQKFGKVYQN